MYFYWCDVYMKDHLYGTLCVCIYGRAKMKKKKQTIISLEKISVVHF